MIKDYLKEAADFFETNPTMYNGDWVAHFNGARTTYLNPHADQWDIIGIIGKLYHDKENTNRPMPLWMFRRLVYAFREANQMDLNIGESPLIIYMNEYADRKKPVTDVVNALRLAYNYMVENPQLDQPLDLTPPPPPPPPRKGGFVL